MNGTEETLVADSLERTADTKSGTFKTLVPTTLTNTEQRLSTPSDVLAIQRDRLKAAVIGTKETFVATESYIQSILTGEILGQGFFGTVYKAVDTTIGCPFAIKVINSEILVGGNVDDVLRARKTFEMEQKVIIIIPDDRRIQIELTCLLT